MGINGMSMKRNFLKEARKKKNLTQIELSKRLGYRSSGSVSNWENGWSTPPLRVAVQVACILEEDVEEIFPDVFQKGEELKNASVS